MVAPVLPTTRRIRLDSVGFDVHKRRAIAAKIETAALNTFDNIRPVILDIDLTSTSPFAADLYTAISGIGYLIVRTASTFQVDKMFVPIVTLALLGVTLTALLRLSRRGSRRGLRRASKTRPLRPRQRTCLPLSSFGTAP
jgi:hypothetical protein